MGISQRSAYIEINQIIDFLEYHASAEVTCEDLEELNDMERSLVKQWNHVLCLIKDKDTNDLIGSDDHSLVSAVGMAVGYTRRK